MTMGKTKGNAFEREICKKLSLWWSGNTRDDLFWRTDTSGGRATSRGKKGLNTSGQYGDICSRDGLGDPLTRFFTFELKRGYNNFSLMDLIDTKEVNNALYMKWINKAIETRKSAKSVEWAIIVRRNRREELVIMSLNTCKLLGIEDIRHNFMTVNLKQGNKYLNLVIVTLDAFFSLCSRQDIIDALDDEFAVGSLNWNDVPDDYKKFY